jgi:anti-sigma factor RsiW
MRLLPGSHPSDEVLVALLDHELRGDELSSTEQHIEGCTRCATLLVRQERAHRALASEWAAEMALYSAEQTEPAQRWSAAGAGVLVGAVGALTVAGLLALRHRRVEAAA